MISWLQNLSRFNKQLIMVFIDSILVVLIILASLSIRLGYWFFPESNLIWMIFSIPIIAIPIFIKFGLYSSVIRYMSFKALWDVSKAVTLYTLILGLLLFMLSIQGIPRSVILINWMLTLLVISGTRIIARYLVRGNFPLKINRDISNLINKPRALIYGAGDAGIQLISALKNSTDYHLVGLIDDSKKLQGIQINGLTVYCVDDIDEIIEKYKVNEVLIAIPSISRHKRLAIIDKFEKYPVIVRMLPGITELAQGKVSVNDLREVNILDLLGRTLVAVNKDLLSKNITNKIVMVTGAGGSIGSELCQQIILLKPKALILYEMNELSLYKIDKELSNSIVPRSNNINMMNIYPILGSVNNKNRLSEVFNQFDVDTIYHTAAYKHVPLVEFNSSEGVTNNIFGTLNCAQASIDAGVGTFVLISTDKAVRPTNIMGATKRVSELVLQALSTSQTRTMFSIVRFGNVLGSSGSVIPLFKKQIKAGGPVTVTDINIVRYFMTISEAIELVIQAGSMGKGGEVFLLDMGKQVKIRDLALKMINLSGLELKDEYHPNGDIEIIYTGLRPGEKLYEELLIGGDVLETSNPLIMRALEEKLSWNELNPLLDQLRVAVDSNDQDRLRRLLIQLVPDFKPQLDGSDILRKGKRM
jgi:FlaA1/EpsC-like NDP-sugar epimerase